MDTKFCPRCQQEKPVVMFYARPDRPGQTQSYCTECFNKYCIARWKEKKVQAVLYKGGKCIDCSRTMDEHNPAYLFDFHHLDPSTKECSWNKMRLMSFKRMQKELDKCVCLCVICHRHREYKMVAQSGLEPEIEA